MDAAHSGLRSMDEREQSTDLPVDLAPMSNSDDLDRARTIVNQIHDPVIAHTNAVAVLTFELRGSTRPRLPLEPKELPPNASRLGGR